MIFDYNSLESFLEALSHVEDDVEEFLQNKPGFTAEYQPIIALDRYRIEIIIEHETDRT